MAMRKDIGFPGGSKKKVNVAGERVRKNSATARDFDIIEEWRAAHRAVLNTFQATLRGRTRNKTITVAQRHKRRRTIFDKLHRFPKMNLVRMDDIAGCRVIFENIEELYRVRSEFHKARFLHHRRNDIDRYDYIKNPKSSGYRGVHDVYEYDVRSLPNRHLNGLYVELQYRTLVQHASATAVEVVGHITESQPKFDQGDDRYKRIMLLASEILSRAYEQMNGALPDMSDREVIAEFAELDKELHLMDTLRNLNSADQAYSEKKNMILVFAPNEDLQIYQFRDATEALRRLFELEREFPARDIVLVRADSGEDVRVAFRNYFSDARDFVNLIDGALPRLRRKRSRAHAAA